MCSTESKIVLYATLSVITLAFWHWVPLVFMQDNAPSHASNKTRVFLPANGFLGNELLDWPSPIENKNLMENLWSNVENEVYSGGRQISNNEQLSAKISEVCDGISPSTIHKLTKSVHNRLVELLNNGGGYVSHQSLSFLKHFTLHGVFSKSA